jgi:hypothetical protein
VYRNLHKKCWSIKQRGLVVGHADELALKDCECIVNPKGRHRVIKTGVKTVHAYIKGFITRPRSKYNHFIWYHPFISNSFYIRENGIKRSVNKLSRVIFVGDVVIGNE